jgi:ER degradation enhancer, mannosidase alpha-like 2
MKRLVLIGLLLTALGCATDKPPERPVLAVSDLADSPAFAAEVVDAMRHAWSAYETHAWGHDALRPLSQSGHDWYDTSLLMTPLDAFDTLVIMGMDEEAARAKTLVLERLTFDLDMTVQVFEITIRHLGALLAAHQLDGDQRWLDLAVDLADRMLPAFDSPTGMPYVRVNLKTGATEWPGNNPAEIGTLMLEFGQLSKLTGDPKYYDAAKRAVSEVYARRSPLGLVGTVIDVESGAWTNSASHVGGMIDSYYEYLLKAWLLFGDTDFHDMWTESRAALTGHLAHETGDGLWYGIVDMDSGERTDTTFGALHAFLPAVFALDGDLEQAARLQNSVYKMWIRFDIEPELFDYATNEMRYAAYPLRPEAIESAYYLYTLTGDERWRGMGRDMFDRIVRFTRVKHGFAHVKDVQTKELDDAMESFFLAETLKYAYMLAVPSRVNFDAVIFNTEAHPLRSVEH